MSEEQHGPITRLKEWYSSLKEPKHVENDEGNETMSDDEYDGPRLGEMIKFSVLFGPEGGMGAWPCDEGTLYITPKSAYQYRNGEWVDLEADTEEVFRAVAMYIDPEQIRQRQQQW